jgi:hypothetical protein
MNEDDNFIVKDIVLAEAHPDLPESEIDEIINNFDAAEHEPPVTIGHQVKDSDPSFGWVRQVWKKDKELWGKVAFIPEMADLIKREVFKNRSISVYQDFNGKGKKVLRHLAILGAVPPRIKGMPALEFKENGDYKTIDFMERGDTFVLNFKFESIADILQKIREYFIEQNGVEKTNAIFQNWDINRIRDQIKPEEDANYSSSIYSDKQKKKEVQMGDDKSVTYSEAQFQSLLEAALEKQKKELTANFSEEKVKLTNQHSEDKKALETKIKSFSDEVESQGKTITALKEEIEALKKEKTKIQVTNHAEALVKDGKLKPVDKEELIKVYSEVGEEQRKQLIEMDKNRPKLIEFGELAGAAGDGPRTEKGFELREKERGIFNISPELEAKYGKVADGCIN